MATLKYNPEKKAFNVERFNGIIEALLAGLFFGSAPVLLKIASEANYISVFTIIALALLGSAFLLMQRAMFYGKVSVTVAIVTSFNIVMPFLLGIALFNEQITWLQWFGAFAIIFGAADLVREANK